MALMVASIAKNQVYSHPSILKQSPEQLARRPAPKPLGLPENLHKAIIDGMDRVVSPTGTARAAIIEGVDIGGKTGTAQINKKDGNLELAWFVGFAYRGPQNSGGRTRRGTGAQCELWRGADSPPPWLATYWRPTLKSIPSTQIIGILQPPPRFLEYNTRI